MTRRNIASFAPVALALALTACGSDGTGSVASVPPPVPGPASASGSPPVSGAISVTSQTITSRTPLASSVATTAGTYDTVAWLSDQAFDQNGAPAAKTEGLLSPSPITITADPASHAFSVHAQLPDGVIERKYVGSSEAALNSSVATNKFYGDFGYHIDFFYNFSDGTKSGLRSQDITHFQVGHSVGADPVTGRLQTSANTFEHSGFSTDIGLRYVSFGEWDLGDFAVDSANTRQVRNRTAEFVYGLRTAPSDLPASGTASYSDASGVLHLDADFGARTIAANLDYPVSFTKGCNCGDGYGGYEGDTAVIGVKASGVSPITPSADFSIPLNGTAITPVDEDRSHDVIAPVTGAFAGAFFGPQAAEAGGIATIVKPSGDLLWAGVPYLLGRH